MQLLTTRVRPSESRTEEEGIANECEGIAKLDDQDDKGFVEQVSLEKSGSARGKCV